MHRDFEIKIYHSYRDIEVSWTRVQNHPAWSSVNTAVQILRPVFVYFLAELKLKVNERIIRRACLQGCNAV
jgi:hypothetical protein